MLCLHFQIKTTASTLQPHFVFILFENLNNFIFIHFQLKKNTKDTRVESGQCAHEKSQLCRASFVQFNKLRQAATASY